MARRSTRRIYRTTLSILFGSLLGVCLPVHVSAQKQNAETERMLLSDPQVLLDLSQKVRLSGQFSQLAEMDVRAIQEAAGNVQVITTRQLEASGAYDLFEALQLVPGISFGTYTDAAAGVGIHGNWAALGGCLFLLNGLPLNENHQGGYAINERIPMSSVDHIEVLLGPASMMHGGQASLAVVNIVTRTTEQGSGTRAQVRTGIADGRLTRTVVSFSGAHRLSRNQEISYTTAYMRGNRSNTTTLLPDGRTADFSDSTATSAAHISFAYTWKKLRATMVHMEQTHETGLGGYSSQTRDLIFGLEQQERSNGRWRLGWKVAHAEQTPFFRFNTTDQHLLRTNTSNSRTSAQLVFTYKIARSLDLRLGASAYHLRSAFLARGGENVFAMSGTRSAVMNDGALFGELAHTGRVGSLVAGYRAEYNDPAGHTHAPRFSYTKTLGRMHIEALWGAGFRTPTPMYLHQHAQAMPQVERARTTNAEIGMRFGTLARFIINGYNTRILHPIVHVPDSSGQPTPLNRTLAGSEGMDLRFDLESKRVCLLAGVGLYRPLSSADVDQWLVPDSVGNGYRALPGQRAFIAVSWDISPTISIRSRYTWRSTCWSLFDHAERGSVLTQWPAEIVGNAGLTWRPGASTRLSMELGCNNLFDTYRILADPMGATSLPLVLDGRQWNFALTYKFVQ
jgi:outer membrane receptor protein involved in Fe transport